MSQTYFKRNNELTFNNGKSSLHLNLKSSLPFLNFWPNINSDFFQENLTNFFLKKDLSIYKGSIFGKFIFFYFFIFSFSFLVPPTPITKSKSHFQEGKIDTKFKTFSEFCKDVNIPALYDKIPSKLIFPQKNAAINLENEGKYGNIDDELKIIEDYFLYYWNYSKTIDDKLTNICNQQSEKKPIEIKIAGKKVADIHELRLKHLSYEIYKLQMTQFAESIKRIEGINSQHKEIKDDKAHTWKLKFDEYKITFDEDCGYPPVILNEKEYKALLSFRDLTDVTTNITDAFINTEQPKGPTKKRSGRQLEPRRISSPYQKEHAEAIETRTEKIFKKNKNKLRIEPITERNINDILRTHNIDNYNQSRSLQKPDCFIGKYHLPFYPMCHHCKMVKPPSELIKCQNDNLKIKLTKKTGKELLYFYVNQSVVIKKEKYIMILNYEGNISELIEEYLLNNKEDFHGPCKKFYCKTCLKMNYNTEIDKKAEKTFICPYCNDLCSCTRCFRVDQLIKLIADYITMKGDFDQLYNYMDSRHPLISFMIEHLVSTNFLVLDFADFDNIIPIKGEAKQIVNQEKVNKCKDVFESYQNALIENYHYLELCMRNLNIDRNIINSKYIKKEENENSSIINLRSQEKNEKLLGKKRPKLDEEDSINEKENTENNNGHKMFLRNNCIQAGFFNEKNFGFKKIQMKRNALSSRAKCRNNSSISILSPLKLKEEEINKDCRVSSLKNRSPFQIRSSRKLIPFEEDKSDEEEENNKSANIGYFMRNNMPQNKCLRYNLGNQNTDKRKK